MAFGKQTAKRPASTDDKPAPAPPKRASKHIWLRLGILAVLVSTLDLIYIGGTGNSLIELESETKPDPTFHAIMSFVLLIFGVIALVIHFGKTRD
ncbi:MAG TPA: hypothetical protein VGQ72_04535 [Pyrinomonadaceae bacterium]|jgi:hypothetical protein|nr:hypothetical protein [Pyrinomonadaceae bacterium]